MAEYPKWLHKDWKTTETQGPGHYEAGHSQLVATPEDAKELLTKGWTEAPPSKPEAKAEPVVVVTKHKAAHTKE